MHSIKKSWRKLFGEKNKFNFRVHKKMLNLSFLRSESVKIGGLLKNKTSGLNEIKSFKISKYVNFFLKSHNLI